MSAKGFSEGLVTIIVLLYAFAGWAAIVWWEDAPLGIDILGSVIGLLVLVWLISLVVRLVVYLRGPADA